MNICHEEDKVEEDKVEEDKVEEDKVEEDKVEGYSKHAKTDQTINKPDNIHGSKTHKHI